MNLYLDIVKKARRHFFDPTYIDEKYQSNIEKICYHARNSDYSPDIYFDLLYTHILDLTYKLRKYKNTLDFYMCTNEVKKLYEELNILTGFF